MTAKYLLVIIASLACGFFITAVVNRFMTLKGKGFMWGLMVPFFALMLMIPSWIGDENTLLAAPFFLLFFLLFGRGWWLERLVFALIFFALVFSLNMMIDTFWFNNTSIWRWLVKLLVWSIIYLLVRHFTETVYHHRGLSKRLWLLLGSQALAPFFAVISLTTWHWRAIVVDLSDEAWTGIMTIGYTVLPFVLLSALAMLVEYLILLNHEELQEKQRIAEKQEIYYQGILHEQKQLRILRHDLRNHVLAVQGLLTRKRFDLADKYLGSIAADISAAQTRYVCDNTAANAVIVSKLVDMEAEGIDISLKVFLPQNLNLPDAELCALLGNALDNAMEGVRKTEDKKILLFVQGERGLLMLRVENTIAADLEVKKKKLKTTKHNKADHGLGLLSMDAIVRRHDGTMSINVIDERFELLISIPLE